MHTFVLGGIHLLSLASDATWYVGIVSSVASLFAAYDSLRTYRRSLERMYAEQLRKARS